MQDSGQLLAVRMTVDQPGEIVRIGPSSALVEGKNAKGDFGPVGVDPIYVRSVTHLNDALLTQLDLSKMEYFWFTAADKTRVAGIHH